MSSLDKMVEQILAEAADKARALEREAKQEAEALLAQERQRSSQIIAEKLDQAKREDAHLLETGRSGAEQERKRQILAAKQQMITQALEQARARIEQLPEKTYFEMICRLAAQSAQPQEGQICLNRQDLERMPDGFEERLNQGLSAGRLSVSSQPREIDGGCVLVYGGVEENLSLSALFAARQEELRDLACQILFAV